MRKILLTLLTTLLCSVTAWGATDFTAAQIASGTTTSGISVSSYVTSGAYSTSSKQKCKPSTATNAEAISIANSANGNYNQYYIEIQAPANCTISSADILVRSNGDGNVNGAAIYWTGVAGSTIGSSQTMTATDRRTTDCDATTTLSVPASTRTIRLYRGPKIKSGAFDGSGTVVGGTSTFNVFGVSVTAVGPVTHTLTNVTKSTGATSATLGAEYAATYAADAGYSLPASITVTIGGSAATAGTDYTWNSSTGAFTIPAAKASGAIVVTIVGESGGGGCTATANAGADKVTTAETGVALAATAAGSGKTGTWSITSKPDGSTASTSSFTSVNSATATFTPDKVGDYTLTWTVECDEDDTETASDNMTVTANCIAISPTLSYASVGGTTLDVGDSSSGSPTVSGNTGSGTVSYEVTSASPAGCLTVNALTGVASAVAAGSATVTATVAESGNYCGNTATANFTIADDCTDPDLTITLN